MIQYRSILKIFQEVYQNRIRGSMLIEMEASGLTFGRKTHVVGWFGDISNYLRTTKAG